MRVDNGMTGDLRRPRGFAEAVLQQATGGHRPPPRPASTPPVAATSMGVDPVLLATEPPFDVERVAALRHAVAAGLYSLRPEATAAVMIAYRHLEDGRR